MNRRSFLAGLGAGIAALAVTTRLATSELRLDARRDLEADYVAITITGTGIYGEPVEETLIITAEEMEEGSGQVEAKLVKQIEHIAVDNHMELRGRPTLRLPG